MSDDNDVTDADVGGVIRRLDELEAFMEEVFERLNDLESTVQDFDSMIAGGPTGE